MFRRPAVVVLATLTLAGCGALKEALTSHVDVAARAGSRELSSTQLAEMMAAAQMPARKELGVAVANLWVNYQLLAQAGARGDTAVDATSIDEAMWAQIAQSRLRRLQGEMQKGATAPDAAALEKAYNNGELLAARHILISADKNVLKPNQIDSARKVAENVRKQATPANFVSLVQKYSGDPGSKATGGEYVFPPGMMVPEFEATTKATKPGEISAPVQTQFGFHIILRETYAEAKAKFDSAYQTIAKQKAESLFISGIDKNANVQVKDGVAKTVKAIAEDVDGYRNDKTVLATSRTFDLRASRVALWLAAFPPQMQIRRQLSQAPDSIMPEFLKGLMRNELLLKAADSAKILVEGPELDQIRNAFRSSYQNSLGALSVLPGQLADSAKGGGDRAAIAAARVDAYLGKLLRNEAQFVDVSEPVSIALRRRYDAKVTLAGIERAVTQVDGVKKKADSAATANLPKSEVPVPGAAGAPAAEQRLVDSIVKAEAAKAGSKKP
jgi:hypothetical protein